MMNYRLVATYGSAPSRWTSNITDLNAVSVGGRFILTVTTQSGGGVSSFDISDPDKPMQVIEHLPYLNNWSYHGMPQTAVLELGGRTHLYQTGLTGAEGLSAVLDHTGDLGSFSGLFNRSQIGSQLSELGQFKTPSGDFLYSAQFGDPTLKIRKVQPDGRLSDVSQQRLDPKLVDDGASLEQVVMTEIGGQKILVAISGMGNAISTHLVGQDGRLGAGDVHVGAMGIGFQTPTAVEVVQIAGKTFVVVAAQGSSSLSVFELSSKGGLTPRDHILDELSTRFQSVTALATAEVDGRTFVFAGGRDDGISIFTIQPDGRLLYLDSIIDTDQMALTRISAIEAQVIDGRISLFVASGTEAGITQLVFDPGNIGFTGVAASGSPTGTDGDDLMISRPGTIRMNGGPGDDILIATTESIALTGGQGSDIFVAAAFKGRIAIRDFELGVDRLDLSQLGMIRSVSQLTFSPQSYGIKIFYGETVIDVFSSDRRPLKASDFDNSLFPVAHYHFPVLDPDKNDPSKNPSTTGRHLFGTSGADVIRAGPNGDFISGEAGNDQLFGGAGNDTLNGGDGNDTLRGHSGDDQMNGGRGNDTLFGDAGNDALHGHEGNDLLYGGDGDDLLYGDDGHDSLYGDAGDDTLIGGAGNDYLSGDNDDDLLEDMEGNNTLVGGNGNDTLISGRGRDLLDGGPGDDIMKAGDGNDTMWGGPGDDRMEGEGGNDVIHGGMGNDSMYGGVGHDSMWGGEGGDVMYGAEGNDHIFGGPGNDWQSGGVGNDRMLGAAGNDTMYGGDGDDWLDGGFGFDVMYGDAGNDTMWGGPGDDFMDGGDGNDRMTGGPGHDTMHGGAGADTMFGGPGGDLLYGGQGPDILHGGAGHDTLRGEDGSDQLFGGPGDDLLIGGLGSDTMQGGPGRDIFRWEDPAESRLGSADLITAFQQGMDRLDLSQFGVSFIGRGAFGGAPQVRWEHTPQQTHIRVDVDGDGRVDMLIRLGGLHHLNADDFLL